MAREFLNRINPFHNRKDNDLGVSQEDIQKIAYEYGIDIARLFVPSTGDFARVHKALKSWWSWRAGEDYQKQGRRGITIFGTREYGEILEQSLNGESGPQIPIVFIKSEKIYYKDRLKNFTPFVVNEVERVDWGTRINISELAFKGGKWLVRNDVGPLGGISNCFYMSHLLKDCLIVADRVGLENAVSDAHERPKPFWKTANNFGFK